MHAVYVRVSTDDQAKHGYSLLSQWQACQNRLLELGLTDIKEYKDEGASGEFLERPALGLLREDLQAGIIETVMMYDPDRMSRNLTVQLILADEIEKAGAKLLFVTGDYDASPEGKLFFSMKGAVSAYEKAKIRERTLRGRRQKAAQGKIVSNARPFGYSWDKTNSMYVVDDRQAETVRLIYHLFLQEGLGCRAIALELKRRGVQGPKGLPLSPSTVHKILSKEMYCGTHYIFTQQVTKTGQKKRVIKKLPPADWVRIAIPAIISRELWQSAQLQLRQNQRLAKRNCQQEYLLRGILRCALCGRRMLATTRMAKRKKNAAKTYSYYTCISMESATFAVKGQRCDCMRIPVNTLDEKIWDIFTQVAKGQTSFLENMRKKDTPDYKEKIDQLTRSQQELWKRHREIARLIREGLLDAGAVTEELKTAHSQIQAITSSLNALKASQESLAGTSKDLGVDGILACATFEQKRRIILRSGLVVYAVRHNNDIHLYLD